MSAVLQATKRTIDKNSTIRKIREAGNIPAVLNGENHSDPIYVNSADFLKTIRESGRNGIIKLAVNNEQHSVMLHDLQKDKIKSEIIHADFKIVNLNTEVEVTVHIHLTGDALGVKDGGVLQQPIHQLSIRALPANIPSSIDIDVSNLEVGQVITVGDIQTLGKYEINHEDTQVIASILPPKQEEEINSGEEQEPGHPESEEGRETQPTDEE